MFAGAKIDLEELYDQKKEWDDKFGAGDDTAHSSRTVRPESTPRLSVAVLPVPHSLDLHYLSLMKSTTTTTRDQIRKKYRTIKQRRKSRKG
jgi:hypothetical protein